MRAALRGWAKILTKGRRRKRMRTAVKMRCSLEKSKNTEKD
jgi:hypothetical protein